MEAERPSISQPMTIGQTEYLDLWIPTQFTEFLRHFAVFVQLHCLRHIALRPLRGENELEHRHPLFMLSDRPQIGRLFETRQRRLHQRDFELFSGHRLRRSIDEWPLAEGSRRHFVPDIVRDLIGGAPRKRLFVVGVLFGVGHNGDIAGALLVTLGAVRHAVGVRVPSHFIDDLPLTTNLRLSDLATGSERI